MINLGDLVRDRITGFEGVAISKQTYFDAEERFALQPRDLKDGQPAKIQVFDESDLKLVKARVIKSTKANKTKFKLGDHVKDVFSEAQGHITAHVLYINGCHKWQFTQSNLNNKNQIMEHLLQEGRLEMVKVAEKTAPKAITGGDYPDISGGR